MPEPHQPSPQGPSDDTSVDPAAPADVAPVPDTEELLRRADLKAQEHHDAWLRAKAEAENIRKRTAVELANAYKYAIEAIAADLLPVKDSLEATLAADSAALETLRSGVDLTLKQLNAVFAKANLREINPIGEKFVGQGTEHDNQRAAKGLQPARPGDPAGAGHRGQAQGRSSLKLRD